MYENFGTKHFWKDLVLYKSTCTDWHAKCVSVCANVRAWVSARKQLWKENDAYTDELCKFLSTRLQVFETIYSTEGITFARSNATQFLSTYIFIILSETRRSQKHSSLFLALPFSLIYAFSWFECNWIGLRMALTFARFYSLSLFAKIGIVLSALICSIRKNSRNQYQNSLFHWILSMNARYTNSTHTHPTQYGWE